MIIFWLNASLLWMFAIILAIHTFRKWHLVVKKPHRASEVLEILLFVFMGFYMYFLFSNTNTIINSLMWILFLFNLVVLFFFLGNVLPNFYKKRLNPEFRKNITYCKFIEDLKAEHTNPLRSKLKDRITDYSRKILHILQFIGYVSVHYIINSFANNLNQLGIVPIELRNYTYFCVACFFWTMMLIGDITRMECFECLPRWAFRWYKSSLNIDREEWTINAVFPILLANLVWIHPVIPTYVFFMAVFVSCISDAVASFIGKEFGKKKWNHLAYFHSKTQEGTFTAALVTIIGCIIILLLVPTTHLPLWYIIIIPIGNAVLFIIIDMYGHFFSDNLLNSLITGLFSWSMSFLIV